MLPIFILVSILLHSLDHSVANARAPAAAVDKKPACNFFRGRWVADASYPMYDSAACPFIEREFDCLKNGRPDKLYLKYRWQPTGCNLASFDGKNMLKKYRGKNILFSGDSLTRDQYMSFVCLLYKAAPGTKYKYTRVNKVSTLLFLEHGIKVTLDRNSFLVDLVPSKVGALLKLDSVAQKDKLWKNNHLMVFNTGHWWGYKGAQQVWKYMQIGNRVFKDMERAAAMEMALNTWAKWVTKNVDPAKTMVFYLGYSPSHYIATEWNDVSAKSCAEVKTPLLGLTYPGGSLPTPLVVQKRVVANMTAVAAKFLDITALSLMRVDAHPGHYGIGGAAGNDCTHWCVGGLPDTWNLLMYNLIFQRNVKSRYDHTSTNAPDPIRTSKLSRLGRD